MHFTRTCTQNLALMCILIRKCYLVRVMHFLYREILCASMRWLSLLFYVENVENLISLVWTGAGVPWTEDEHRLFLIGLQKLGKGDWRGISRNFVQTRTPTQVASHAQKYFIRQSNMNKRKRRSSLFDIVSESVNSTTLLSEDV